MIRHKLAQIVLFLVVIAVPAVAGDFVPFKGTWTGSTISATLVGPNVVFVVTAGPGNATHLGRFEMTVPHYSYLDTLAVEGEQILTAANGDVLNATFTGFFVPRADGCLEGTLPAVITGGTGRFSGASGSYNFHIVACPGEFGFDSVATIEGVISSPGRK